MALDPSKFRIRKALIAETRHQNPLDRTRLPFQLIATILVLSCSNFGFDRIAILNQRFEHVRKIAPLVTNRVANPRHVLSTCMAFTSNLLWAHVPRDDDIRIQRGEVEFMDVLVQPNIWCKGEPTSVGIVELAHRFELLVAPGMLWNKDFPLTSFLNSNSSQYVPDRRPTNSCSGLPDFSTRYRQPSRFV